ncbi:aspartic proteinase CDR1-like [Corylus avellana]|uniref:aspartic proteinase CDR1-like n=1 Tax=Corylus avellana TaxID=13451 RepID=UPI00286CB4C9|nr:aspartic proteinase CDR1-like [Corylus avellana]
MGLDEFYKKRKQYLEDKPLESRKSSGIGTQVILCAYQETQEAEKEPDTDQASGSDPNANRVQGQNHRVARYVDGSFTEGVYAKESETMTSTSGEKVSFDISFGCSHNSSGEFKGFNDHGVIGIIGLGLGGSPFVTQIASVFGSRSFSHCFTTLGSDPNLSSKMSFGNECKVSGVGVVSKPLISTISEESFYYVEWN